jgi:dihydroorotate dehydrogenase
VIEAREKVRARVGPTPVLLKIAPDLTLADLDDVVGVARKNRVDGMIVTNTTISRPSSLRDRETAKEQGGCLASRCSSSRRGCWRRPLSAPRAPSR